MDNISKILLQHIEVLNDRKRLSNFLDDVLYGDKRKARRVLYSYDADIVNIVCSSDTNNEKRNFLLDYLQKNYDVTINAADDSICFWENLLSIEVINEYRRIKSLEQLKKIIVFGEPRICKTTQSEFGELQICNGTQTEDISYGCGKHNFSPFLQYLCEEGNGLCFTDDDVRYYIAVNGVEPDVDNSENEFGIADTIYADEDESALDLEDDLYYDEEELDGYIVDDNG